MFDHLELFNEVGASVHAASEGFSEGTQGHLKRENQPEKISFLY